MANLRKATLLPPSASVLERDVAQVIGDSIGGLPVKLRDLWSPDTCPVELLPYLAWGLSIDAWKNYWPEQVRRARVRNAIDIQRHKGTVASIHSVVESFGGAVTITEWWQTTPQGTPGTFQLTLTLSGEGGQEATAQFVDDVIAEIDRTKPVSRHYDFTQVSALYGAVGIAAYVRPCVMARLSFTADPETP
mgnify:CR=1 FL=1